MSKRNLILIAVTLMTSAVRPAWIEVSRHPRSSERTEETRERTENVRTHRVRATYYNPVPGQCQGNPLVTADNSRIDHSSLASGELKWIAISRDLRAEYPYGTKVRLVSVDAPEINGVYEVHDCMAPRFRYSIDILTPIGTRPGWEPHLVELVKV